MLAAVPAALQERHPVSGRVIAPVMGVGGAGWLERPEREAEEEPSRAIEALDLRTGMTVADIGAGSGYYTVRMARKVGAEGRVYATDIQVGMLSLLQRRAKQEMLQNIVPVLGAIDDPKLPSGSLDLALMVDVYHEFEQPYEMLAAIVAALKPAGRVAFVEFRGNDPKVPIKPLHTMTEEQVRREAGAHALEWIRTTRDLPWQHVIVFRKQ